MDAAKILRGRKQRVAVSINESILFLVHESEPNDRYENYLAQTIPPKAKKDNFNNSLNFFDDSNREDRQWLKIARLSLGRNK